MKHIQIIICLFFLCFIGFSPAYAAPSQLQTVRISAFNLYPAIFQAKDGSVQGFYVDFLKEIARREGWNIEYVYGNWSDGLARIKTGEVDVLTNVAFTNERAQFLDYGKTQLLTVWAELYVPSGSDIDNIRQIKGKKIALMKGDFNAANFRNLVEKFEIPCEYIEYGNFEEVFKAVSSRQVDGGVVNNTFGTAKQSEYSGLKSSGVIFNPFDIYFAVAKGKNRNIIETLDKYLTEWRQEESSPYHQARKRWAHGSASTIKVTPPWLRRSFTVLLVSSVVALAFIILLRVQVRRRTAELKSEIDERRKVTDELRLATVQLEEELAERQVAQEALQEQSTLLEEEVEERCRAEETLRDEKKRSEQYLDIAQVIMVALDDQARVNLINKKAYEVLGYDEGELVGKDWFGVCLPPEEYEAVFSVYRKLMAGESSLVEYYENFVLTKKGEKRLIAWRNVFIKDENGRVVGTLSSGEDITERMQRDVDRKHLEEQLRQSQKMEAVGQLAGGVAHDFNNILQVIIGYGNIMQMDSKLGDKQKEMIGYILSSADKASHLTKGLLTFSRKQVMSLSPINLNDIVHNVEKFLVRIIGEDIQLKTITCGKGLKIYADTGQIEQILINLATNSRDAMQKGGLLTIETGLQVVETQIGHEQGHVEPGRYAVLTVSDSGSGMGEETCKRVFEPFFTTKETGKGTGLGMAIVYGVVKQHNGFINVYSELGHGTTFRIYIPIYEADPSGQKKIARRRPHRKAARKPYFWPRMMLMFASLWFPYCQHLAIT